MLQRLYQVAQATANALGVATFTFPSVPAGLVWTGTVGVRGAPTTAVFEARVGVAAAGVPWGSWQSNGTFGPVQGWGMETLVITATGLTPSTTFYAQWIGDSVFDWEAAPVAPSAFSTTVSASTTSTTTITSDAWTGGNTTDIAGRATDCTAGGVPKTWTRYSGTPLQGLGINAGLLVRNAVGSVNVYGFDAGAGDVEVSLRVPTVPTVERFQALVRADLAAVNGYALCIDATGPGAQIGKRTSGGLTLLGSAAPIVNGDTVLMRVVGSSLSLYVNGLIVGVITDTDWPATVTGAGLRVGNVDGFAMGLYTLSTATA